MEARSRFAGVSAANLHSMYRVKSFSPDELYTRNDGTIAHPQMEKTQLKQKFDRHGDELWREDANGDTEMNIALPEAEEELYDWVEKRNLQ